MNFLRTSLLVATCAAMMTQVSAASWFNFGSVFGSKETVKEVVQAPVVAKSFSTQAADCFGTAKNACVSLAARTVAASKDVGNAIVASVADANNAVDASVIAKAPWFKNHTNVLTASKVVAASAVLAVTGYLVKKAANAIQAYKNSK